VELVAVKELLPLTGYIRGGCSPVGMKKAYPLFLEETAVLFDAVVVSEEPSECRSGSRPRISPT
jgi:Cys-tRNA(Pro)/Cys-tRNA(Cys) deacylase